MTRLNGPAAQTESATQALSAPGWEPAHGLHRDDPYDFLPSEASWVQVPLHNPTGEPLTVWMKLDYWWVRRAQAQLLGEQGQALGPVQWGGQRVPVAQRAIRSGPPSFEFTLAPGQRAQVLLRTEGAVWWPRMLVWLPAAEGRRVLALETAVVSVAIGVGAMAIFLLLLLRTPASAALSAWALCTGSSEIFYEGHSVLLPWLDDLAPWADRLMVPLNLLSHLTLAVCAFALFWQPGSPWKRPPNVVLPGLAAALASVFAWCYVRLVIEPMDIAVFVLHTLSWMGLGLAVCRGLGDRRWLWGALVVVHVIWLISFSMPHGWGRWAMDHGEVRLAAKLVLISLILAAHTLREQAQRRHLQASLLKAEQDQARELESQVAQRTQELNRALEVARVASQAKSQFISSMSHELRTPMNAILGFSQMMGSDPRLMPEPREHAREINRAGHHLLELIDDVLDLSKIEAGRLDIQVQPTALLAQVQTCVDLLRPQADHQGLSLQVEWLPDLMVSADALRLRQVLMNLLSNAIKYNRPQGSIVLRMQALDAQWARVSVQDSGRGISEAALAKLFQPFERGDARYGDQPGTGIGLALSRRLVDQMGGRLGFESREGEGSTFWVDLPRSHAAAQTPQEHPERNDEPSKRGALPAVNASPGPSHDVAPPAVALQRRHRVLAVDDNPVNLRLLTLMLKPLEAVELSVCQLPLEVIPRARALQPSLILMDINMPELDGYALLEQLRQAVDLPRMPVLAVSADAMLGDVERGRAAGFADYVTKPLEATSLRAVVVKWLSEIEAAEASP